MFSPVFVRTYVSDPQVTVGLNVVLQILIFWALLTVSYLNTCCNAKHYLSIPAAMLTSSTTLCSMTKESRHLQHFPCQSVYSHTVYMQSVYPICVFCDNFINLVFTIVILRLMLCAIILYSECIISINKYV